MGVQIDNTEIGSELVESTFIEIFKREVRQEIELLKKRILLLENRLEDPFG